MLKNIFLSLLGLVAFNISPVYAQILSPGDAVVTGFSQTVKSADQQGSQLIDLNGPSVRVLSLPASGPFGLVNQQNHFTVTAHEVGQVFGVAIDNDASPNIYVAATAAYGLAIYQKDKGRLQHGMPGAQFVPGLFGPSDQGGGSSSIWRIDGKSGAVTLFANVIYHGIENTPASLGGLTFDAASQQLFVVNRATGMIHRFTLDGIDHGVYDHGVTGLIAAGQQSVPFDPSKLINISNPGFDTKSPKTWGFAPIERRVFAVAIHQQRLYYSVAGSQIWSVGIASDGSFANDPRLEVESLSSQSNVEISAIAFDDYGSMYVAERGFPTGESDFIRVAESEQSRVIRFLPKASDDASPGFWILPSEEYAIGMKPEYKNANGGVDLSCGKTVWSTGDSLLASDIHINGLQGNAIDLVKPANMPPEKSWFINYYDAQANPNSRGYMGGIVIWKMCGESYAVTATTSTSTTTSTIAVTESPSMPTIPPLISGPFIPGFECPLGGCMPICPGCCFWPPCPCGPWGLDPWGFGPGGFGPWGLGPWGLGPWGLLGPWDWGPGVFAPWGLGPWDLGPGGFGPWGLWAPWNFGLGGFGPWGLGPWNFGPWGLDPWGLNPWDLGPWGLGPWGLDPWDLGPWGCNWGFSPCIFDEHFLDGPCLLPLAWCPGISIDGHCFSPVWPIAVIDNFLKKQVAPITACKSNEHLVKGKCVPNPILTCKSGERLVNGKCVSIPSINCKPGERLVHGKCIPIPTVTCKSYERLVNGKCIPIPGITCKPGERLVNGKCVPIPGITCKPYERLVNGKCVPIPGITCKPGERLVNGKCVPIPGIVCKPGERLIYGRCVPIPGIKCKPGERLVNGKCVPKPGITCKPGERLIHGRCVPIIPGIVCKPGERLVRGKCIPKPTITCKPNERLIKGRCVPIPSEICKPYQQLIDGKCVTAPTSCGTGEVMINGRCVSREKIKKPKFQPKPLEREVDSIIKSLKTF